MGCVVIVGELNVGGDDNGELMLVVYSDGLSEGKEGDVLGFEALGEGDVFGVEAMGEENGKMAST